MCGIWNVDKLEEQISGTLVVEWNRYLDFELTQISKAIIGAAPSVIRMAGIGGGLSGGAIKLTNPDDIGGFFDAINKKE